MPNKTIDLRKIKSELKSIIEPDKELPAPPEEKLLMTEEAAHPEEQQIQSNDNMEQAEREQALLSWQTPEFEPSMERGLRLIFSGSVLIIAGIVTLFFGNYMFTILLAISGGLIVGQAFRQPRRLNFYVSARGIKIGLRIFQFEDLKSFWIFYDPPFSKELSLQSHKTFMPMIRAPLGDLDPLRLRKILLRFLKEEKHEESLSDIISKVIGF